MSVFDKIANGGVDFHGIWRIMPSTALTEIIAQSGFDFQVLDCEHGAYDYATLNHDMLACGANGCSPFVRVSGLNKVEVQRCLDMGAHGIVFPQLETFEDFGQAVALMGYAPGGVRGFNPFVRANKYGINKEQTKVKPLCITIIETLKAVSELDRILSLEVDIIYIGSYDLSAQLDCIGQMDSPRLAEVVDGIISKCKAANKPVSLMVHNKAQYDAAAGKGVRGFLHSVDSFKIKSAFSAYLDQY